MLNGLILGCYQPSPEVLLSLWSWEHLPSVCVCIVSLRFILNYPIPVILGTSSWICVLCQSDYHELSYSCDPENIFLCVYCVTLIYLVLSYPCDHGNIFLCVYCVTQIYLELSYPCDPGNIFLCVCVLCHSDLSWIILSLWSWEHLPPVCVCIVSLSDSHLLSIFSSF